MPLITISVTRCIFAGKHTLLYTCESPLRLPNYGCFGTIFKIRLITPISRHVSKPFKSSEEVYLDLICLAPNLLDLI